MLNLHGPVDRSDKQGIELAFALQEFVYENIRYTDDGKYAWLINGDSGSLLMMRFSGNFDPRQKNPSWIPGDEDRWFTCNLPDYTQDFGLAMALLNHVLSKHQGADWYANMEEGSVMWNIRVSSKENGHPLYDIYSGIAPQGKEALAICYAIVAMMKRTPS